ncbi:hypothetical protein [Acidipropionibacterium timonense]|uniref:hypothetical protein n=1 Tax=Acidipropionibacterium timonense TaxID=2161818 RepID=UPI00102FF593|nr:hypothetical protein [Acidipropionibacterium timonense]
MKLAALGSVIEVDLSGTGLDHDAVRTAWSRCLVPDDTPCDHDVLMPSTSSMSSLTQEITRAFITTQIGHLLMFHAGAVCNPDTGASLVYIAPGGTGKTTLTRLLGTRYGYLTDETVAVEPGTWRILPYPKPLSFRVPGKAGKDEISPDELGLVRAHPEPHVAAILLLDRSEQVVNASVTPQSLMDAVTFICGQSSSLSALGHPLHTLADLYHDLQSISKVTYTEAADLMPMVNQWIGSRP